MRFGVNCSQEVTLEPNGQATIVVTDILNEGTYVIDGDKLTITSDSPGDAAPTMRFTLAANRKSMTDEQGQVWTTLLCGVTTCTEKDYCEVVDSDTPEFDGSFVRHQCRPLPGCDTSDTCTCIVATERCQVGTAQIHGRCTTESAGFFSLTCNIGG
jgi:hypothetical protein